jgi:hypothetical protein
LSLAVAPLLGAGEPEVFPKKVEEHPVFLYNELVLDSIDGQCNVFQGSSLLKYADGYQEKVGVKI